MPHQQLLNRQLSRCTGRERWGGSNGGDGGPLAVWPSCSSPLKGDWDPRNSHYIRCIWGWLLRGTIPRVPIFSLWNRGWWADEHPGIRRYTYWKINILNPTNGGLVQMIFRISIEWFLVSMSIFRGVKDLEKWWFLWWLTMMHRFLGKGTTSLKHCFCWIPCWFSAHDCK